MGQKIWAKREDERVVVRACKTGSRAVLVLAVGAFLVTAAMTANAGTLRGLTSTAPVGSSPRLRSFPLNRNGASGASGNHLFASYDIGTPVGVNPHTETPNYGNPGSDNVIRLVDPNGCGNDGISNVVCGSETDLCAMVYVFDDDQEMGECCGCLITPNQLESFSVRSQLVNNWDLATQDNSRGTIVVVGSAINDPGNGSTSNGCGNGRNPTCNDGCSPTVPALTSDVTNFVGSITHDQLIAGTPGVSEIPLFNQGGGEAVNNAYLVEQCGVLIANSSHIAGFCNCNDDETPAP